jgi:hypothetical protein
MENEGGRHTSEHHLALLYAGAGLRAPANSIAAAAMEVMPSVLDELRLIGYWKATWACSPAELES